MHDDYHFTHKSRLPCNSHEQCVSWKNTSQVSVPSTQNLLCRYRLDVVFPPVFHLAPGQPISLSLHLMVSLRSHYPFPLDSGKGPITLFPACPSRSQLQALSVTTLKLAVAGVIITLLVKLGSQKGCYDAPRTTKPEQNWDPNTDIPVSSQGFAYSLAPSYLRICKFLL